ncbi:ATP-dependent DNA helicase RecQ [Caldicoprobacter guelmensis]|uniref:RecQ family ATP-dependent DNA helicase n=1 Tax=Caldicoprobacter guelmensis TaxID=1170224 RepID=UPI001958376A|nr:ATP-dependent DNA helicase RecQ [Caldicoprobacter guelmensis]MBM7583078.1 ATP-dependent DNA helicase RecQ [Caldicoprobacter guelmensis]
MSQSEILREYLQQYFGHDDFRLGQRQVVESILQGENVLAVFPTGSGKSLCYQLPAIMLPGITLVISPLISLMKDQVDQLSQRGIPSTFISSILSEEELLKRMHDLRQGKYKVIYIAPERFYSEGFIDALKGLHVSFVAVDEAHCISQWGHSFRPAYLRIKDLIEQVGSPIVGAFTATANRRVQEDIVRLLGLKEYRLFVSGFDRPNLEFRIEMPRDKQEFVLKFVKKNLGKPGIIYAATRKTVEDLYSLLINRGIPAGMYHAGLSSQDRVIAQDDFTRGKTTVMVATNAFGMGIDKSDIRYIIHYNMPRSLEHYYQEVGRAGRDGKLASCILLYSEEDYHLNRALININYPSVALVESVYNRVLEAGDKGIALDVLLKGNISKQILHSAVRKLIEYNYVKLKSGVIYPFLSGRKFELTQEEIDQHKKVELEKLDKMVEYCLSKRCLRCNILEYFNEEPTFTKCGSCSVCGLAADGTKRKFIDDLLKGILNVNAQTHVSNTEETGEADAALLDVLKRVRERIAQKTGVPRQAVFDDSTLERMAALKPVTRKQLFKIDAGIEQRKVELFADEFLLEIHRYLRKKTIV